MNKYEITTQKKKENIINTALVLFKDKGFTGVTIKEIAAQAKVSQVSIYNYFGSKELLFTQCAQTVVRDGIIKAKAILREEGTFIQKIRSALLACSSEISNTLSEWFAEQAANDPVLSELLIENINQMKREIYREYIEYGKEEGAINPDFSTDIILELMDAMNVVGSRKQMDEKRKAELPQLYDLFLYGIIGKH